MNLNESRSTISQYLQHPAQLMSRLLGNVFPAVCWKLPHQDVKYLITDLRPGSEAEKDIDSVQNGFFFNKFEDHHPVAPLIIKGDILLKWNTSEYTTKVSPVLNSIEIEQFENYLHQKESSLQSTPPPSSVSESNFLDQVQHAIDEITKEELDKVVLSRYEDKTLPEGFDAVSAFERACAQFPNAMVYLAYLPEGGTWLGATPEVLLETDSEKLVTNSLAGTQKLEVGQSLNDVAWTQKEIEEQAMVSRYIINCFKKIRLREFNEKGPHTVQAGHLAHLKTTYEVDLSQINMPELGKVLLDLLHPTSAVCGMPLEKAKNFLKNYENINREYFTGFLGPVSIEDQTHLFVNLRCMQIMGNTGRFYAGAGITQDSDPEKEFRETELKMQTLKSIIFH
ncbi:MAG: isochorismate synthase [Cyclobacteriaceae bacterium]|nr:isochorismate synthase [Cyclobacteriaceae bacterium HetDA_MAG_MS6]